MKEDSFAPNQSVEGGKGSERMLSIGKGKGNYSPSVIRLRKGLNQSGDTPKRQSRSLQDELLKVKEENQELTITYNKIVKNLRQEKLELEKTVEEQRRSVERLQKDLAETQSEKEGYVQMLGSKLIEDESKLMETAATLSVCMDDSDREKLELKHQLKELKVMMVRLHKRFTASDGEKNREIAELGRQLAQIETKHRTAAREMEGVNMEKEELNAKLLDSNAKFVELQGQLGRIQAEKEKEIEELSNKLKEIKNTKPPEVQVKVTEEKKEDTQQLATLKNELEMAKRKLNYTEIEKNRRIQELTEKLAYTELRCKKDVSIYNEHIKGIVAGDKEASSGILEMKEKLIDLEVKLTESENDNCMRIDDLKGKLFKSESELKKTTKENIKTIEKLNKDKEELSSQLAATKDRADRLQRSAELLKDEKKRETEKWSEKLADAEARGRASLKTQSESAMREKAEHSRKAAEMKSTIKTLEKKVSLVESENKPVSYTHLTLPTNREV
eukprot:TRINITY_DN5338_c0_g2_i3.p1 TRINITY_DN5338_c0_g2~~TRINITY_DN5338_c0_g2_i3.p1  ORF type:complete len:501 (-),score=207.55 TRINITY_DN5338_c0_g2_i3:45-1547(-)